MYLIKVKHQNKMIQWEGKGYHVSKHYINKIHIKICILNLFPKCQNILFSFNFSLSLFIFFLNNNVHCLCSRLCCSDSSLVCSTAAQLTEYFAVFLCFWNWWTDHRVLFYEFVFLPSGICLIFQLSTQETAVYTAMDVNWVTVPSIFLRAALTFSGAPNVSRARTGPCRQCIRQCCAGWVCPWVGQLCLGTSFE